MKRPVSGIAMGIIVGKDSFKVLTDIQGLEDHYGDMDFKAAGTEKGITALQMDVKVDGVTLKMLDAVLKRSRKKSHGNLGYKILAAIPAPRENMSQYAPRILTMHINPAKIRNVIGTGGKIINEIIDETGVQIDINDGSIFITSSDEASALKAQKWIDNLTHEVKVGEIFNAKVTRLMNFGAFAEILPGQEVLIHISEFSDKRIAKIEDVAKIGDIVPVKVKQIDNREELI